MKSHCLMCCAPIERGRYCSSTCSDKAGRSKRIYNANKQRSMLEEQARNAWQLKQFMNLNRAS